MVKKEKGSGGKKKGKKGEGGKDDQGEGGPMLDYDDYMAMSLYNASDLLRATSEFVEDIVPEMPEGYIEDNLWTDIRIGLGLVCCSLALYSWFGAKLPEDRDLTLVCVVVYFVISWVIYYID